MPISFKEFFTFIKEAESVEEPKQLDEIFGRFFGKEEDKEAKKDKVLTAKDLLAKKKEKEEERRKKLQKIRDEAWLRAKEHAEGRTKPGRSERDEYALHRSIGEKMETRNKEPGFFTMSDTGKILKLDLRAAKQYLNDKVDKVEGASAENTRKARKMIAQATTIQRLAIDVSNFILAHETLKNKVIR